MKTFLLGLTAGLLITAVATQASNYGAKLNDQHTKRLARLKEIASKAGKKRTLGLKEEVVEYFLKVDADLREAIDSAYAYYLSLKEDFSELLFLDEQEQIERIQKSYVNFYDPENVTPYVPIGAKGPWVVTSCGAVIHDSGGYGMLGLGHAPASVLRAMNKKHVMANVMTPSFSQAKLVDRLHREIGQNRQGEMQEPYTRFLCLNSGSEAVSMAVRLADVNAKKLTDAGAKHEGKTVKFLTLKGSFHGRTDRPAQASDSCLQTYRKYLASFQERDNLVTVEINDVEQLQRVFAQADREEVFFEAMLMEPVQGEGNPGKGVTPEFYQKARELTQERGTLLIVDSIQAALRAHGVLSVTDYPGFEGLSSPDMETFSKALNGGQYPLSVLAMNAKTAGLYVPGIYGNTMTTNPRALEVACAVLDFMGPHVRQNIVKRGKEFLLKLEELREQLPDVIEYVQGTGLLFSVRINSIYPVEGKEGLEEFLRTRGIGVIHGGVNSLRFTPHFQISSAEIDMIVGILKDSFVDYVSQKQEEA